MMDTARENQSTATATAPTHTLRVAIKEDNPEQIVLGTWTNPPRGYRFAKEHEIRDVLNTLPAPTLRDKIFEACTSNQAY